MKKNLLCQKDMDLIHAVASRLVKEFPCYEFTPNDLYYTGIMALEKAKEHYNDSKKTKFRTYTYTCIFNAMKDEMIHLNSVVKLPKDSWPNENITRINDDLDYFDSEDEQDCAALKQARLDALGLALDGLSQEDRQLVMLKYGFSGRALTLKELGESQGVTPQAIDKRIRRIEQKLQSEIYKRCA
ncbi:MAG: sigma-70 family RNA polymerase sigma factor [Bacteroidales bacterium]|nr:sigma-70 family RNA polymerase sigma factor [Bacteroidales bacterium]